MNFKEWLKQQIVKENATCTASVAGFSRMLMPAVRRQWPEEKKKNKKP